MTTEAILPNYLHVQQQGYLHKIKNTDYTTQVEIPKYNSSQLDDVAEIESYKYPEKYRKTIKNYSKCSLRFKVYYCLTEGCSAYGIDIIRKVLRCHLRYCSKIECVDERLKQAYAKISRFKIKSKRLYHFTIGSNRLDKKQLQKIIQKYITRMRNKKYKLSYIKVFDIGKKNYNKYKEYFNHFHIAILPERLDTREFITLSKVILSKINNRVIFNNIGYRKRTAIYSYFAKRVAGKYGHKKEGYFYLKDIMTLRQYLDIYHNQKVLTYSLPKGLIHMERMSDEKFCCEKCNETLSFYTEVKNPNEKEKPPP